MRDHLILVHRLQREHLLRVLLAVFLRGGRAWLLQRHELDAAERARAQVGDDLQVVLQDRLRWLGVAVLFRRRLRRRRRREVRRLADAGGRSAGAAVAGLFEDGLELGEGVEEGVFLAPRQNKELGAVGLRDDAGLAALVVVEGGFAEEVAGAQVLQDLRVFVADGQRSGLDDEELGAVVAFFDHERAFRGIGLFLEELGGLLALRRRQLGQEFHGRQNSEREVARE
mmetsp:Transcript_14390/g.43586  ORF Transcript_14390/g.43586 Transcript_14390/m.43586 type:complete len:227 (-) Transcript_14390:1033-1713(-)